MMLNEDRILYEDNHLIIVNKLPGEIVQGDQTGDRSLIDDIKLYLKEKYNKPGNVFLGLCHRLDRPTSGAVVYAKTDKALSRMSQAFRDGLVEKRYLAVVDSLPNPGPEGRLEHFIYRDVQKNKSFAFPDERSARNHSRGSAVQNAVLEYRCIGTSERYFLLEIKLITGRHHQIRAQLASCGVHIKGDLKYGFPRSNPDGGICLHSGLVSFVHPVSKEELTVIAPMPQGNIWELFKK